MSLYRESARSEPIMEQPEPGFHQRWRRWDGLVFVVEDYVLNSMTPWECRGLEGTWFRLPDFHGCTYLGPA